jgi:hypothetical protein
MAQVWPEYPTDAMFNRLREIVGGDAETEFLPFGGDAGNWAYLLGELRKVAAPDIPTGPEDEDDAAKLDAMANNITACIIAGITPSKAVMLEALQTAYELGRASR